MNTGSIATVALLSLSGLVMSGDENDDGAQWSQFRGPGGSGIAADDTPLPATLDPEQNLLWKCELPAGLSSPCIFGERIFVTGASENELSTLCIDRSSGEVLWADSVAVTQLERMHDVNSAAASTCTTDGEHVISYFGAFGLVAYTTEGEELWRRELPLARNTFGSAASPILVEGMLVFVRDTNDESYIEAIDPGSGETIWHTERSGFPSGWSTPVAREHDDGIELIVYGVWWITAYDLADGHERWAVPGLTDEPIITPVMGDGLVFLTSYNMKTNTEVLGLPAFTTLLEELDDDGSGDLSTEEIAENKSVLSRADADGEGDHPLRIFIRMLDGDRDGRLTSEEYEGLLAWVDGFAHENALMAIRPPAGPGEGAEEPVQAEVVWQHGRGVPECPSPLYYRGRVYVVKNGGLATCLDARTGELLYEGRTGARGPIYASPVAGDGKVFTASARGEVTVLAAGDELKVLSRTDLGERIMATPALVGGRVYVRSDRTLFAFGAKE